MAYDESLAARIRQMLARRKGCTEKKMIGDVGLAAEFSKTEPVG